MFEYLRNLLTLIRLDKPIGIYLLFFPCCWGVLAATETLDALKYNFFFIVLFLFGSIIMRGAGCIINDIFDRNLDKNVLRTRERPIASGKIRVLDAIIFFLFLCCLGLAILLSLNFISIIIGLISFILLVLYPLAKRLTYWPQLVLGLTFNTGVLIGYSSVSGYIDYSILSLYCAGIFWTLGYDTIYAIQDIRDDEKIGIKSTALLFGKSVRIWVSFFYFLMMIMLFIYGITSDIAYYYFLGLVFVALILYRQINQLSLNNTAKCLELFKSNQYVGLLICFTLLTKLIN